ncbi:MAG: tetratricopeptide repeat protein [Alphaproteobacteria bacterium]|nr:tetratricopeptide repeat protein [Alphaproteobacteria bacterium]
MKDRRGDEVTGATPEALDTFEAALAGFQCYAGDPLALLDRAAATAPGFAMAHLFRADLLLSGTEGPSLAPARASIAAGAAHARTARERLHVAAATALADGRFEDAVERFEDILLEHPRDALALEMAHIFDFFRGDARNLRDRVVRVLPAWSEQVPGYHALLGMLAFGLEETGDYARAEDTGRRALDLNPRDAWAHHAVAHVLEMQGRAADGVKWMREREAEWAPDNFFAVHNWWHLALFHLDQDHIAAVKALYQERIRAKPSTVVLEMIDAAALLWRLYLRGVPIEPQFWTDIAATWTPLIEDGNYAFNDVHALMAFLGAGRSDLVAQQLATLKRAAAGSGSNAPMAARVGVPVGEALIAFAAGDYARTIERLRPLRAYAQIFGGSHAQRDLLDLTLIEAASRGGQRAMVCALAAERVRAKPSSPLALRYRDYGARAA